MLSPVEFFIATRHLRSRNRSRFVSFIALISLLGIALSVAVLIIVLSVMNGFEFEVRQRILSVVSHGSISGLDGRLEDWEVLNEISSSQAGITATAPFVSGQGMLVGPEGVAGIEMRGIDPAAEAQISGVADLITEGGLDRLESRAYRIVIGQELANRLGVALGEKIVLLTTQGSITPAGLMPRMRRFEVAGIFYAGMYEFDRSLAYVHIDDAARLMRLGDAVTGISIAVDKPMQARETVRNAARAYGGGVYVTDWTHQHANFFRSIELTKTIIFMILLMVVAVAAFNIVSTLVMVVREKSAEIAILRSMGASSRSILLVFVGQGTLIGLAGTLIGLLFGLVIAFNLGGIVSFIEAVFNMRFVAPDIYFISELPSQVRITDVIKICTVAFALAVLATIYPALRAAATNPAEALRHE
jgi:lipoprotein-releasing system permease protein